ncbi:MAG: ribosome maturation factor RimP [Candidatus Hydrothermota bacterium]|uniref:Ribosome maturation factor RimP n=1 Tax=candidate division WOR-3 bacterium TaxID=2052148 RepID=A0A7C0XD56_UNCW3|nr:MAG: ribosome maturation factor RimP [Candidatus Hydrothermae bacterium]RKZ01342.1 MAG: ribosome maturation factor RimP [Candidatus Hydrothermae bacterium]HDM90397.1 ribosome maturation factor RimP [candidate division WOR-3 bacterium]
MQEELEKIEKKIEEILAPLLEERRMVLVDLELKGAGRRYVLRIFVDKEGGISVNDCADLSEELSYILDVEDPVPGPYILEVSSPGLDRVLKKERELKWARGKKVRILTESGEEKGRLEDVQEETLTLDKDGKEVKVNRKDIKKIQLDEI